MDDSLKPYVAPSRHDMDALALELAKESQFLIGIAKLGEEQRRRGGYRGAEQVEQTSQVHGDDGA